MALARDALGHRHVPDRDQNSPGCRSGPARREVHAGYNLGLQGHRLPQGSFRTNLGNMRVTYNFTPSMFAQSLVQYNDGRRRWSGNLRFHRLRDGRHRFVRRLQQHREHDRLGPVNRAFIAKYVKQFDILR